MTERLLASLKAHANSRGLVLVTDDDLAREVPASPGTLSDEIEKLVRAGLIEVLSPQPFLVIKLKTWPARRSDSAKTAPKTGVRSDRAYSFQSSLSQSIDERNSYRQPDRSDPLLHEILEALGESDPTTFRGAIENYPPHVIRTALTRIRRMKTIHKNRTAVFRFLLPRIGKESPSST